MVLVTHGQENLTLVPKCEAQWKCMIAPHPQQVQMLLPDEMEFHSVSFPFKATLWIASTIYKSILVLASKMLRVIQRGGTLHLHHLRSIGKIISKVLKILKGNFNFPLLVWRMSDSFSKTGNAVPIDSKFRPRISGFQDFCLSPCLPLCLSVCISGHVNL